MRHAWPAGLASTLRCPLISRACAPAIAGVLLDRAARPAKGDRFAKAAYRKFWLEGRATSDADAAAEAGATLGLEHADLLAGIQEASVKDRLIRVNEEAIAKGVFGSPFFIVDGEPYWGSERIGFIPT